MDHIRDMNKIIEKSAEYNIPFYMAFIDYTKAFDSVEIAAVLKALPDHGVLEDCVRLLEGIYNDSTGTFTLHKRMRYSLLGRASGKERQSPADYSQIA